MSKRSYRQDCALARTSDLIGERWSVLLIRDLLTGPKRYKQLHQSLRGMGTNLLAQRLKELEDAKIIEKTDLPTGVQAYALTEPGRALEPAILALVRWGLTHLDNRVAGYYHQDDWDLVALKSTFKPERAGKLSVCTQFLSGDHASWVEIRNQQLSIGLGEREHADIKISGTIKDLFVDAKDIASLQIEGSTRKLKQFMSSFAL